VPVPPSSAAEPGQAPGPGQVALPVDAALPVDPPVETPDVVLDERPSTRASRRPRATPAPPVTRGRALAGAAVAVVGVLLLVLALLALRG